MKASPRKKRKYRKRKHAVEDQTPRMQTITVKEPKSEDLFLISGSPRQIAEFVAEMRRH